MYVWSSHIARARINRVSNPEYCTRMYLSIYVVCRVWINRARVPILLVVSWTGENICSVSLFTPVYLVSGDRFGRPVPRQPASSPHSGWIWWLLTGLLLFFTNIPSDGMQAKRVYTKNVWLRKKNAGAVLQKYSKILLYSTVQYSISTAVTLLSLVCCVLLY